MVAPQRAALARDDGAAVWRARLPVRPPRHGRRQRVRVGHVDGRRRGGGRGASGERGRGGHDGALLLLRRAAAAALRALVLCERAAARRPVLDRAVAVRRGAAGGGSTTLACAKALRLREGRMHKLLAADAAATGAPIARPLWWHDPLDPSHAVDDAFLLGNATLVTPVLEAGVDGRVYLPRGTWRDARGDTYEGPRWIHEYRALDDCVFDPSVAVLRNRVRRALARRRRGVRWISRQLKPPIVRNTATRRRAAFPVPPSTMRTIYWFRMSSLRLHDHPALLAAAEGSSFYPVFCLERRTRGRTARTAAASCSRACATSTPGCAAQLAAHRARRRAGRAAGGARRLVGRPPRLPARPRQRRSAVDVAIDALAEAAGVQVLARGGTICDLDVAAAPADRRPRATRPRQAL